MDRHKDSSCFVTAWNREPKAGLRILLEGTSKFWVLAEMQESTLETGKGSGPVPTELNISPGERAPGVSTLGSCGEQQCGGEAHPEGFGFALGGSRAEHLCVCKAGTQPLFRSGLPG